MKFRDIFTITAVLFAVGIIAKLLESSFSKDDGVFGNEAKEMLSNKEDKDKILEAIRNSKEDGGKVQNVTLSSKGNIEVSTSY